MYLSAHFLLTLFDFRTGQCLPEIPSWLLMHLMSITSTDRGTMEEIPAMQNKCKSSVMIV